MDDHEFMLTVLKFRQEGKAGAEKLRVFLKQAGYLDRLFQLAKKGAEKRPVKHKERSSLPAAFPTAEDKQRAREYWASIGRRDLDAEDQASKFCDHHRAHGSTMAHWPAAWTTWFKNAPRINRLSPFGPPAPVHSSEETAEVWAWRNMAYFKGDPDAGVLPGFWKDEWGGKPGTAGYRGPKPN